MCTLASVSVCCLTPSSLFLNCRYDLGMVSGNRSYPWKFRNQPMLACSSIANQLVVRLAKYACVIK